MWITEKESLLAVTKDVEVAVPLEYLSNFCRTLELPLINGEINLTLTWTTDCIISSATVATKFAMTDTKLIVPVVTLPTQDNMQNYYKNWNQVLKEQLTAIKINLR